MSDLERAQEWLGCERDEFLHLTRGERVPFCSTHDLTSPATWPCPEATRLAALLAETRADECEQWAQEFDSEIDWSDGRSNYGDNAAYESAARLMRARAEELCGA